MKFDVVIIGGGAAAHAAAMDAVSRGLDAAVISRGKTLDRVDFHAFVQAGGTFLPGDSVVRMLTADSGEDKVVTGLLTENLGDTVLTANLYVLATGKFFGGGLVADMEGVREALLGLEVEYEKDRAKWFDPDFSAPQPFMRFGVKTDPDGHPVLEGKTVTNLIAVGDIRSGRDEH